jgi:hypothetical protein
MQAIGISDCDASIGALHTTGQNRVSCVLEGDEVCVTDLIDVLPFFQLAMPLHDAQPVREKTPAVRPSADLVCSYCEVMVYVQHFVTLRR